MRWFKFPKGQEALAYNWLRSLPLDKRNEKVYMLYNYDREVGFKRCEDALIFRLKFGI